MLSSSQPSLFLTGFLISDLAGLHKFGQCHLKKMKSLYRLVIISLALDSGSISFAILIGFLSSSLFSQLFNLPPDVIYLFKIALIGLVFKSADTSIGLLRILDKFWFLNAIEIGTSLCKTVIFAYLYFTSDGLFEFIIGGVICAAVNFSAKAFALIYVLRGATSTWGSEKPKEEVDLPTGLFIRFSVLNNLNIGVRMVSRQLDNFLIAKFVGVEALGIYKIVKEVANVAPKVTNPVYQAIYPELAKLLAVNLWQNAISILHKISLILTMVCLIGYFLLILVGEQLIVFAFGLEYISASGVLNIYFIAIGIAICTSAYYPFQLSMGRVGAALSNQIIATILYVPVVCAAIFFYGLNGAALGYVFYYFILSGLTAKSVYGKLNDEFRN